MAKKVIAVEKRRLPKLSVGIDLGGTAAKLVACRGREILVCEKQPVCPAESALAAFRAHHDLPVPARVVLTGIRAAADPMAAGGIPVVPEFEAIGAGGLALAGLDEALVVSMGTGTALIQAAGNSFRHLGGSGVGGGTLCGLGALLLGEPDPGKLAAMAASGNPRHVDLLVGDLCESGAGLPETLTVANFGKISPNLGPADLALALITMVLQTTGLLAVFATQDKPCREVVLTGAVATLAPAAAQFEQMGALFGPHFQIPPHAAFATAYGALMRDAQREGEGET